MFDHEVSQAQPVQAREAEEVPRWCLRCLLLVMCTHPFAKKALTLYLARSKGREHYFGCNLMHRKVLASSHQHLIAEAPRSDFGKAVRYMLERWAKLTLFVENPLVYPDNNAAERALRGPVVGRKNHYGN